MVSQTSLRLPGTVQDRKVAQLLQAHACIFWYRIFFSRVIFVEAGSENVYPFPSPTWFEAAFFQRDFILLL